MKLQVHKRLENFIGRINIGLPHEQRAIWFFSSTNPEEFQTPLSEGESEIGSKRTTSELPNRVRLSFAVPIFLRFLPSSPCLFLLSSRIKRKLQLLHGLCMFLSRTVNSPVATIESELYSNSIAPSIVHSTKGLRRCTSELLFDLRTSDVDSKTASRWLSAD